MASYYTVVQYVPDPVTDERINIGVIVAGGGVLQSRFLSDWRRAKQFGVEDIAFLKDFAGRVRDASELQLPIEGLSPSHTLDVDALKKISGEWINSIQITTPRASLAAPNQLLSEMADRFLREPTRKKRAFRDRRAAAGLAARHLEYALADRVGRDLKNLVKRHFKIEGRLDVHHFDVGVVNGAPYVAAQGLSFDVPASEDLDRDVEATAWTIDDVQQSQPAFPVAIIALRPSAASKTFDRAIHVFEGLGARVVYEEMLDGWATAIAARVDPL